MNKIILTLIIFLLVFSCKNNPNNINVSINDIPDGRKVKLKQKFGNKVVIIDSTTVLNGKFGFNTVIKEPVILGIFIDSVKQGVFPLIDVNDKIHIVADKDSLQGSKITGSKLQNDLTGIREMEQDLNKKMSTLTSEFQKATKENDSIKIEEIQVKAREIQSEISLNQWKYIKANPSSHVSAMILSNLFRDPNFKDSIKNGFDGLSDNVKNSNIAKQLKEYLEKQNQAPVTPQTKGLPSDK